MNPAAAFINQRYNIAFKYLRRSVYENFLLVDNAECLTNTSNGLPTGINNYSALLYILTLYIEITDTYAIPTTLAELKTKFDYTTYRDCFACHNISLDDLVVIFDLEAIALTNLDTQVLIDAQPTYNIPVEGNNLNPIYQFIT
ncbi:MAG: hypothetical protein COA82_03690 [Alkaliphilus sp.]|nr:MAG: hypothetical protein COA82_03690 [Alkaliphilus sp.]